MTSDNVDHVRLLIADTDPANQLLTYDQLADLIEREGDLKLAAAQALDIIAASEVLVGKKIRTQDLASDGPAVSQELRALADRFRADVDCDGFAIVDFDPTVL